MVYSNHREERGPWAATAENSVVPLVITNVKSAVTWTRGHLGSNRREEYCSFNSEQREECGHLDSNHRQDAGL